MDFLEWKCMWISINISLKFVPRGPINNIPTLVQVMAWSLQGDKPLSEPMMVRLPRHICVTGPQWVNCVIGTFFREILFEIQMLPIKEEALENTVCKLSVTLFRHQCLKKILPKCVNHYSKVMMGAMASQITSLTNQRKHQSSASLAFFYGSPVTGEFPHIWPVTQKMFPFDDVIM